MPNYADPPTLDNYISVVHRHSVGREHTLELEFMAAFKASPELVAEARAEKVRLEATRKRGREDFPADYEGRVRHAALTKMLEQFDAAQGAQEA